MMKIRKNKEIQSKGALFKETAIMVVILFITLSSCDSTEDDSVNMFGDTKISNSEPSITGSVDGHDYVDLGFSVKWAVCNVGAAKPEGYGSYFAWGETSEKSFYGYSNYTFYKSTNYGFKYIYTSGGDISGTRYDAACTK